MDRNWKGGIVTPVGQGTHTRRMCANGEPVPTSNTLCDEKGVMEWLTRTLLQLVLSDHSPASADHPHCSISLYTCSCARSEKATRMWSYSLIGSGFQPAYTVRHDPHTRPLAPALLHGRPRLASSFPIQGGLLRAVLCIFAYAVSFGTFIHPLPPSPPPRP